MTTRFVVVVSTLLLTVVNAVWFQGPCSSDEIIKRREGYNPSVHIVQSVPHICYGFNLKKSGAREQLAALGYDYDRVVNNGQTIAQFDCQQLLDDDMDTATQCAARYVTNFNSLTASRKSVLVDMAYNLGCAGLGSFTKLKAAVESSSWVTASSEIRNSNYCTQVGCRCNVNALCMDPCYALPSSCDSQRATTPPHDPCPTATTRSPTPRPTPFPTPAPPIPCSYSSWSNSGACTGTCGTTNGQQRQTRSVLSGVSCTATMQTTTCTVPPCACTYSSWYDSGACTAPCDGEGNYQAQVRTAQPGSPSTCTDTRRTVYCYGVDCPCTYSSWTPTGACTAPCGQTGNYQRESRFVLSGTNCAEPLTRSTSCSGIACDSTVPPCTYTQWAASSSGCPGPCGSSGSVIENRQKMPSNCNDREGTARVRACTTPDCPATACAWTNWAPTGQCNPSTCLLTESRTLSAGMPVNCQGVLQRATACDCPSPCIWDMWSEWGVCSVCTGAGQQTRTRGIQKAAVNNGAPCAGEPSESRACTGSCTNTGMCTTPIDCKLSEWSAWSECSPAARKRQATEDNDRPLDCAGLKTRERRIEAPPQCNGAACPAKLTEQGECTTPCGFNTPQQPDGGNGNNIDPNDGGNGGTKPVDIVGGAMSSSGGLSTGAIIGIAVGGGLCLLLLIAALIFLLFAARSRSTRGGAIAHAPSSDHVIEGNPLFQSGINKAYNPIFYGNGADASSAAAGAAAVNAAYPTMQGTPYTATGGAAYPSGAGGSMNYPGGGGGGSMNYPSAALAAGAAAGGAGAMMLGGGAAAYPSAGGGGPACVICGKAFPSQADVEHHVQKRHAGIDNGAMYPSAAAGGTMGYGGASNYPGSDMMSTRSDRQQQYPSATGYGTQSLGGAFACTQCSNAYATAADLATHVTLRH